MKINFLISSKSNWGDKQQDISDAIRKYLTCGKDFFVQLGDYKPEKDPKLPNVFFFRQSNKDNLMDIRGNVGKELTRRINEPYFDDFKLMLVPASAPSDNQRSYYFGVVLPTIQEYFKQQGNFIPAAKLDEDIRNAIANEFGLFTEEINSITGQVEKRRLTLSNAGNKQDVRKYIDAVIVWAARDYGIDIPAPPEK